MFRALGRWIIRKFQKFVGFEKVTSVKVTSDVMDDLCNMARSAHPNEMVVFLSATQGVRGGVLVIDEIQIQSYRASTHSTSFNLWNLPTFTNIIGTVHSHPSSSRRPSDADLHLFNTYGLVHGILGYPYTARSISWYDKQGNEIDLDAA